jgi:glycosyltransferase involved in cell wall biosynthesis
MGMMTNPKISIITPCFNAVEYIEQTILSIINQDYKNIEYIIIDGGSKDGTIEIIKKYSDHLAYWISEPDKGQSDAINKGIAVATGDVFNWINADDFLEEGVLKSIALEFQNYSLNVLCSQTNLIKQNGDFIRISEATHSDWSFQRLMLYHGLNQQGMYWKMDVIRNLNGVNSNFNYSMDLDLWKRYLLTYGLNNVKKIELISANFRLLASSKTGSDFEVNFHLFEEENNAALQMYAKLINEKYVKVLQFLFPNFKKELLEKSVHSNISESNTADWLKVMSYEKVKRFFYANDFKNTYSLIKLLPLKDYSGEELKNLKSFRRWSFYKRFLG